MQANNASPKKDPKKLNKQSEADEEFETSEIITDCKEQIKPYRLPKT